MATRRRYTKREKAGAVAAATMTSTEAASESTGIPQSTIRYWMDKPEFAELRNKTRDGVAEEFWTAVQVGLHRIADLIPQTEDLQKVATAVGILYDKHALLTGGATGRTESRALNDLPDSSYVEAIREAHRLTVGAGTPVPAEDEPVS